jgi:hypothetical protein
VAQEDDPLGFHSVRDCSPTGISNFPIIIGSQLNLGNCSTLTISTGEWEKGVPDPFLKLERMHKVGRLLVCALKTMTV